MPFHKVERKDQLTQWLYLWMSDRIAWNFMVEFDWVPGIWKITVKLRNRCLSGFRRVPNRANGFLTSPRYMGQILTVFCVQWDQLGNVVNGRTRPGDTQKGLGWQLGTLPRNRDFLRREYIEYNPACAVDAQHQQLRLPNKIMFLQK